MKDDMRDRIEPGAHDVSRSSTSGHWHPLAWTKAWIESGVVPDHMRLTLVALADAFRRSEGCVWEKQAQMAAAWGIPPRTFRRHLVELAKLGVIEREKRHRKDGSYTSDRIYLLVPTSGHDGGRWSEAPAVPTSGHDGGRWSEAPAATMVAATSGHDGGRSSLSSGVPTTDDLLAPLGDIAADADRVQPDSDRPAGTTDDAGEGMRDCTCEEPRLGRFTRAGRRWCLTCGGYELVRECNCCFESKPGRLQPDGHWWCDGCAEFVREQQLQETAVAVEGVAADPAEEFDEHAEAAVADVHGGVDVTDVPAGAAAGDGDVGRARRHSPDDDGGVGW